MSVELKVGDNVKVVNMGEGKGGKWVLCKQDNEAGKDSIQVWAANPDAIPSGTFACEVMAVNSVKKTAHEYPKGSGKWYPDCQVNATLKPIGANDLPTDGFSKIDIDEIPF